MSRRYRYVGRIPGGVVASDVGPLNPGDEFVTNDEPGASVAELVDPNVPDAPGTVFRKVLPPAHQTT